MSDYVLVFTDSAETAAAEDQPRLLSDKSKREMATRVPMDTLKNNLAAFIVSLEDMIPQDTETKHGFRLKTFDVSVGVDGKGQVGFLGTGLEVGAKATLTLRFERS